MDLSDVKQIYLGEDEVIQITDDQGNIMWKKESPEPVTDLFYIKNESDQAGTLTITNGGGTLRYSTDATNWTDYDFTTHPTISVQAGKKLYLKGAKSNPTSSPYLNFTMDVDHSIGGNIMSIVNENTFETDTYMPTCALSHLFENDTYLIDASNMNTGVVKSLDRECMNSIFKSCTSLVTPPDLSGIVRANNDHIFSSSFEGCSSLTTPPDLSNMVSASGIYVFYKAFNGCSSLTTTPNFSNITNVGGYGFASSFANCSSLTTAYTPKVSWDPSTMMSWLSNVAASGKVYCANQGIYDNITRNSASGVPSGWTKQLLS